MYLASLEEGSRVIERGKEREGDGEDGGGGGTGSLGKCPAFLPGATENGSCFSPSRETTTRQLVFDFLFVFFL